MKDPIMVRELTHSRNLRNYPPSEQPNTFDTLFQAAIMLDDPKIVQTFLDAREDAACVTFLGNAQSPEMIELLLSAGADTNSLHGNIPGANFVVTALLWATHCGNIETVQSLLQHGADANIPSSERPSNSNWTSFLPLRDATQQAVNRFKKRGEDTAHTNDDFKLIKVLLEAGADIDASSCTIALDHDATPLQVASCVGYESLSAFLIDSGANVNAPAYGIGTALFAAVKSRNTRLVQMLLNRGAKVDNPGPDFHDKSRSTLTCIGRAVEQGDISTVKVLLEAGANIKSSFRMPQFPGIPPKSTCLQIAVEKGYTSIVKLLLEAGADSDAPIETCLGCSKTCLQVAIEKGNLSVVEVLLRAGASTNLPLAGMSSVQLAELAPHSAEILSVLAQFGAAPEAESEKRRQLVSAISRKDAIRVQSLLGSGVALTKLPPEFQSIFLREAIGAGDENVVYLLLCARIDANQAVKVTRMDFWGAKFCPFLLPVKGERVNKYISPLGYVFVQENLCTATKLNIVSMMLKFGANPNASIWPLASPKMLYPPLQFVADLWIIRRREYVRQSSAYDSCESFEPRLIRMLLDNGASAGTLGFGVPTPSKTTALISVASDKLKAMWPESIEIAETLLRSGADVNARAGIQTKTSALGEAVKNGNLELVRLLFEYNAVVDTNAFGSAIEAMHKYPDANLSLIIDLLVEKGANVNGSSRSSTLHFTVSEKNLSLTKRLIELGADINFSGEAGSGREGTLLQIAACEGNLEMALFLIHSGSNINAECSMIRDEMPIADAYVGCLEVKGAFVTALELAAAKGRLDMVQLLINAGAETHLSGSKRYRRAEYVARRRSHIAVANLLKSYFEDTTWD